MLIDMLTKQSIEMAGFGVSMLFVVLYFVYLCLQKNKSVSRPIKTEIIELTEDENLEMLARTMTSFESENPSAPPTYEQLEEQEPPSYVSVIWKKLIVRQ